MNFISSDLGRKHTLIDRSIRSYRELLDTAIAQKVSIGSSVKDHRYILDRLTIPNMRHNTLEMSRRAIKAGDYIPIWAIGPGESIDIGELTRNPHPEQKSRQIDFLKKHGIDVSAYNNLLRYLLNGDDPLAEITIKDSTVAKVIDRRYKVVVNSKTVGKNAMRYFSLRPVMILNSGIGDTNSKVAPDYMGHEVEHVRQNLKSPIKRFDTAGDIEDLQFRKELEAYSTQEALAGIMMSNGYKFETGEDPSYSFNTDTGAYSSFIFTVNSLRRRANSSRKDPFFPDGRLRKDLLEMGMRIHSTPLEDHERNVSFVENMDSVK